MRKKYISMQFLNTGAKLLTTGRSEYFVHHIDFELRVHLMFD
jgi:hypothetical protein